jgi:hypothetical protein
MRLVGPSPLQEDANWTRNCQPPNPIEEPQEPQMNQQTVSLMDVLAPPGNHWLKELSHRKNDLPPCVHIVRFSEAEDDPADEAEVACVPVRHQKKMAA